jgi:hypothetical protein
MATKLRGRFETRRDAEMVVERLVQEHGIDRSHVFIAPAGDANSAGEKAVGSDKAASAPGTRERQDANLGGPIEVSVDLEDDRAAGTIREAFAEFGAPSVAGD